MHSQKDKHDQHHIYKTALKFSQKKQKTEHNTFY